MNGREVGKTQDFVLAQGFQEMGEYMALAARDGSRRLLAEVFADPDRPEARPQEAYREMLASLAPGWTMRLLQVTWPDPAPHQAFLTQIETWEGSGPAKQGGPTSLGKGEEVIAAHPQDYAPADGCSPILKRSRLFLKKIHPVRVVGVWFLALDLSFVNSWPPKVCRSNRVNLLFLEIL